MAYTVRRSGVFATRSSILLIAAALMLAALPLSTQQVLPLCIAL
jgi:hypothetical protein